MMSSASPSLKYSFSLSALRLANGSTASDGMRGDSATPASGRASGLALALQPLQVDQQIPGGLVAHLAVLLERLVDDPLQRLGHVRIQAHGRRSAPGAGGCRRAPPTCRPGRAAVPVAISYSTTPSENRSVRASSAFPSACSGDMYATVPTAVPALVSGSGAVSRRRQGRRRLGRGPSVRHQLGQPEVEDLGVARRREEEVGRLDVPMNDPFGVRRLQTVGHLQRHRQDLVHLQPLPEHALLQRLALEQLHRDEVLPLVLVDVVDGADVRVIQGRGRLGLPLEALSAPGGRATAPRAGTSGRPAASAGCPRPGRRRPCRRRPASRSRESGPPLSRSSFCSAGEQGRARVAG